jgi:dolichol-phosphate mannosyltransferase
VANSASTPLVELAVVMPVYNEAECIQQVLTSWTSTLTQLRIRFRLVLIDDGSTDGTAKILETLGGEPWIDIITQKNAGHGPALLNGYAHAVETATWVFQTDSDDEMDPADFPALWERKDTFEAGFGVRQRSQRGAVRRAITAISRWMVRLLFGDAVTDVNVPFRLIPSHLLRALLPTIPPMSFAPNVMIAGAFARSQLCVYNHPLRNRPRHTGISIKRELTVLFGAARALWQILFFSIKLATKPPLLSGKTVMQGAPSESPTNLPAERRRPPVRGSVVAAIVLIFVAALVVRWPNLHQPVNRDISAYATIGARMHHGQWPYRDFFDHKQPLIYAVFWLLGAIAPRSNTAIQITAVLIAGLGGVLIWAVLRRLIGFSAALGAALLLVTIGAARAFEGTDLNTEHLLATVMCLAVLLPLSFRSPVTLRHAAIAGILAALAVGAKAVAVLAIPAVMLALFFHQSDVRDRWFAKIGMFALGVSAPWMILMFFYAAGGGLRDLLWANIGYNINYVATLKRQYLFFGTSINALLVVAITVGVIRLVKSKARDRICWTALLWFAGAAAGAKIGRGDFPHYFAPIVPPAAILACLPVRFDRTWSRRCFNSIRAAAVIAVAIPFLRDISGGFGLSPAQIAWRMFDVESVPWNYQKRVGTWLRAHSNPDDRLFVAGAEAGFYWQSSLQPATKYLYDYVSTFEPDFNNTLAEALQSNPPRFIVLPWQRDYPYLGWLSGSGYQVTAQIGPVRVLEFRPLITGEASAALPTSLAKNAAEHMPDRPSDRGWKIRRAAPMARGPANAGFLY